MSITNLYLNNDRVPTDIVSYTNENFYKFVETFLGSLHSRILQYQHINSVPCFLVTEDPCDMLTLDIDDPELEKLTKEVCVKLKNNQWIVRTGISNSFKCLREILLKKNEEYLKMSKSKRLQKSITNITADSVQSLKSLPLSVPLESSLSLTFDQHKKYLLDFIRQWCLDNKEHLNIDELNLKEGIDFVFNFSNTNGNLEGSIHCKCGTRINLGKNGPKFQLSNFYKHLKDTKCSNMNKFQKKNKDQLRMQQITALDSVLSSSESSNASTAADLPLVLTSTSPVITNAKRKHSSQKSQKSIKKVRG